MSKRSAGDGSFRRLASGRWQARVARGPRGATVTASATGRTQREAYAAAVARLQQKLSDNTSPLTVGDWLDEWLRGRARDADDGELRPTTVAGNATIVRRHVQPYAIAQRPVDELAPADVDRWLGELRDAGVGRNRRWQCYWCLHLAVEHARRLEVVDRNAVAVIAPPRRAARTPRQPVDADAAARLVAAACEVDGGRWEVFVRVALTAPLRPGELYALEWRHVTDDGLRVEQNLVPPPPDEELPRLHDLKGRGQGARTIPLPDPVRTALARHRVRLREDQLAARRWHDATVVDATRDAAAPTVRAADLVFRRAPEHRPNLVPLARPGKPLRKDVTAAALERICDTADVPRLTPNGLRSLAITALATRGVPVTVVQQLAGHTLGSDQIRAYLRAMPDEARRAVEEWAADIQ